MTKLDLLDLLNLVREKQYASQLLRGLFHVLVGRTIHSSQGDVISEGLPWRRAAELLKEAHFDRQLVRSIGLNPDDLSPKDRAKFWYQAMSRAKLDSAAVRAEGDQLAEFVMPYGFIIGPAPGVPSKLAELAPPLPPPEEPEAAASDDSDKGKSPQKPAPKKKS